MLTIILPPPPPPVSRWFLKNGFYTNKIILPPIATNLNKTKLINNFHKLIDTKGVEVST